VTEVPVGADAPAETDAETAAMAPEEPAGDETGEARRGWWQRTFGA
jgi:hypothetical protein